MKLWTMFVVKNVNEMNSHVALIAIIPKKSWKLIIFEITIMNKNVRYDNYSNDQIYCLFDSKDCCVYLARLSKVKFAWTVRTHTRVTYVKKKKTIHKIDEVIKTLKYVF